MSLKPKRGRRVVADIYGKAFTMSTIFQFSVNENGTPAQ